MAVLASVTIVSDVALDTDVFESCVIAAVLASAVIVFVVRVASDTDVSLVTSGVPVVVKTGTAVVGQR